MGILLAVLGVTISAFSQILLKIGANRRHDSVIKEYLNIPVMSGYFLMALSVLLMMVCYRFGTPYMTVAVCESLGFILVPVFSYVFFRETLGRWKTAGLLLILGGILIYNL